MSKSRALVEHIEALNKEAQRWMDEKPGRFAGMITSIPDHWSDYNVYTPEEFDRYMAENDYKEMYQEYYGHKHRVDLSDISDEEVAAEVDSLVNLLETMLQEEMLEFDVAVNVIDADDDANPALANAFASIKSK